jgi:hypothetical protein
VGPWPRDVEGLVEAGGQGGIVGVEGERVAKLFGGLGVDDVERLAVGVLELLEDPAGDLSATVGEGDAVELVFNDGRGFGRGLGGGNRGGRGCSGQTRSRSAHRGGRGRRLRCGRGRGALGRIGGRCLGVSFGTEVLKAKEDGDQDEHHDEERLVVAAALLIGVFKLCQKGLPILC